MKICMRFEYRIFSKLHLIGKERNQGSNITFFFLLNLLLKILFSLAEKLFNRTFEVFQTSIYSIFLYCDPLLKSYPEKNDHFSLNENVTSMLNLCVHNFCFFVIPCHLAY